MKTLVLFEDQTAPLFAPLSLTRPVMDIRSGRLSFFERVIQNTGRHKVALVVRDTLADLCVERYPAVPVNPRPGPGIWLLGSAFWTPEHLSLILNKPGIYFAEGRLAAAHLSETEAGHWLDQGGPLSGRPPETTGRVYQIDVPVANYLWDIQPIASDLADTDFPGPAIPVGLPESVDLINPDKIRIDDTAVIFPQTVIDATAGPVIIEAGCRIHPFCYIQGPAVLGRDSTLSPHTQFKKSFTGPVCKLGGEISATVIQGWTNKVHDGFLGSSFLGEWVNLGAGTTNSNLKNNYSPVSVLIGGKSVDTGRQFAGLYMGDHCKTAIGTRFNTGTAVNPCCNVVTTGFPPKFIRSFTWLIEETQSVYRWEKFLAMADASMARRDQALSAAMLALLKKLYRSR